MKPFTKARDNALSDSTVDGITSQARSAIAGLSDTKGAKVAETLIISLKRMPDALGIDGGRTTALNASSSVRDKVANRNPWNARGTAIAGSLSRRNKVTKLERVARLDSVHTVRHEKLHALNVESVRLHTLVDYHARTGPVPSARKYKRFTYQLHGVQARILDLGGVL